MGITSHRNRKIGGFRNHSLRQESIQVRGERLSVYDVEAKAARSIGRLSKIATGLLRLLHRRKADLCGAELLILQTLETDFNTLKDSLEIRDKRKS